MGYLEGLLGGFNDRRQQVEQQNLVLAQQQSEREGKIFSTLLSSPDPEIQALAATGLLTSAAGPKRAGGIRGWLGEMQENPILGQIQGLIATPKLETETIPAALPSRTYTGTIATPPTSAGMPTTETTTPGATPPRTTAPDVTLQRGPLSTPAPTTVTRQVPRRVFQTPAEAMLETKTASARGDVEGKVAGLVASGVPEAQARETVRQSMLRATRGQPGMQSIAGELPDGTPAFGVFDRETGSYTDPETGDPIPGFRPRTTTGGRAVSDRESIARELFGKPAASLTPVEMAQVNQKLIEFGGQRSEANTVGRGTGAAVVPLSTGQRFEATTNLQKQWAALSGPVREMERQNRLIKTGLSRFDADPVGASEAVIATFKKILDPTSVVRESEYARTPQGLALLDRLQGAIDKYAGGGGAGVPKEILAEMVATADQLVQSMQGWNEDGRAKLDATAKSYGIDPFLIFGTGQPQAVGQAPPGSPTAAQPSAAGPGSDWTMVNGVLHFKGKPY